MPMRARKPVYLLDGCRSPIGRGHPEKGLYADLRADELAVQVLHGLLKRVPIDPAKLDDFYLGCVGQHLEQGKNLARLIILLAGLPNTIPGVTINRLCASSLTALHMAADSIRAGSNETVLVGGVEHLGHVPISAALDYNPAQFDGAEFQWTNMGLTAEKLAEELGISREDQDAFTIRSNQKYFDAVKSGFYGREMIDIALPDGSLAERDQEPRLSTAEQLAGLNPVFKEAGTVTVANSSGISDGAVMGLISSDPHGIEPLVEIKDCITVGLEPERMGLGPVPAIEKLLAITGLKIDDIDLFEINEAFAVQVMACRDALKIDDDKLNIHGGAVAMGHPLGMTGLRLAVTMGHSLTDRGGGIGIVAMCVGHGQGIAILLEKN